MDSLTSKEVDLMVDLECGGISCAKDSSRYLVSDNEQVRAVSGSFDFNGPIKGDCGESSCTTSGKSSQVPGENVELLVDRNLTEEGGGHAPLMDKNLQRGVISCVEDISKDLVSSSGQAMSVLSHVASELSGNGPIGGECSVSSCSNLGKSSEVAVENVETPLYRNLGEEGGEHAALLDKKLVKEKRKKANSKKAPKPPRPPKGPLLDAADMKLVKEISELAMKKRARTDRMKALKKMKAAKSTSSNSIIPAMVITLFFCLVIFFQGICSRSSSIAYFSGSPEPSAAMGGLISVQFYDNLSAASDRSEPYPNSLGQASDSESSRSPG